MFVALAWIGGSPVNSRRGKEIKVPPPATAFSVPASTAVRQRRMASPRCKCKVYHESYRLRFFSSLKAMSPFLTSAKAGSGRGESGFLGRASFLTLRYTAKKADFVESKQRSAWPGKCFLDSAFGMW